MDDYTKLLINYWLKNACESELAGDHIMAEFCLKTALDVEKNARLRA